MATSKLNKEQYANLGAFAGVMLVYNSTNKDGELVQTAQHFWGKDFEPADNSDNEIFRVVKNLVGRLLICCVACRESGVDFAVGYSASVLNKLKAVFV